MTVWLALFIYLALGNLLDPRNIDPAEALRNIAAINDEVSVDLTDENFEHLTQASTGATTGDWLVYFYDPQCTACILFSPQWRFLAQKVNGDSEIAVSIAKVNGDKNIELLRRFRVNSFPTILFFRLGTVYNITGPRDESFLLEMLKNKGYNDYSHKPVPPPVT